MKKWLAQLGVVAVWLSAVSTAHANFFGGGGGCCPSSCPMSYSPCCDNLFNGFYVGGNVGAIHYISHTTDRDDFIVDAATFTSHDINVVGGVQAGWDFQCRNMVLGVVGDWDWSNARTRVKLENQDPTENAFFRNELRWFSTIRARAGLAVCDTLFYVTGGAVVGRFRSHLQDLSAVSPSHRFNKTRWGWTAGVGAEFVFCQSWSLNAEVLYFHWRQHSESFANGLLTQNFDFNHSAVVGRIGVNYRFGSLCCW